MYKTGLVSNIKTKQNNLPQSDNWYLVSNCLPQHDFDFLSMSHKQKEHPQQFHTRYQISVLIHVVVVLQGGPKLASQPYDLMPKHLESLQKEEQQAQF